MSGTGVVLSGDWRRLSALKASLLGTKKLIDEEIEEYAELVADEIRSNINDGTDLLPNSDSTIRRKGFDYPYNETGKFVDKGIIIETIKKDYKKYYVIKGNPNVKSSHVSKNSPPLNYEQIATILEYGAENTGESRNVRIPPRFLFTKAHDRLTHDLPNKIIFKLREEYRRF